ncbi:hypothetical protein EV06_0010 [Prochlorococcus sp. MIT 0602]|nr:hypothetical protein EV07_1548 [Prochlorococcus sp. MIT 0603]KGG17888.1 hypothetical protein EV06_0010 [Prochlorococcus sp. MIT 0602]
MKAGLANSFKEGVVKKKDHDSYLLDRSGRHDKLSLGFLYI